ncbi:MULTISPECIES: S24 family peptidase [unclassified Delftia]|uniref:S24 family peptidase n=1 Tax=unclassified Delftia TaxID=2613839 RepID=UPI001F2A1D61|nr:MULTISPECIES: S24 family peptidase [unclassified Delftia]
MLEKTAELMRVRLGAAFARWQPADGKKTKKRLAELCEKELGVKCTPQGVNGWFKTGRMDKMWLSVVGRILNVDLLLDVDVSADGAVSAVGRAYPLSFTGPSRRRRIRLVEFGDDSPSQGAFFLQLDGDSMCPEFREGDRVLIDPAVTPQPGDYVAANSGKNETLFRKYRLLGHDDSGEEVFELMPLNQDHPVMRSDNYGLSVIGTMLELRRKFPRP